MNVSSLASPLRVSISEAESSRLSSVDTRLSASASVQLTNSYPTSGRAVAPSTVSSADAASLSSAGAASTDSSTASSGAFAVSALAFVSS